MALHAELMARITGVKRRNACPGTGMPFVLWMVTGVSGVHSVNVVFLAGVASSRLTGTAIRQRLRITASTVLVTASSIVPATRTIVHGICRTSGASSVASLTTITLISPAWIRTYSGCQSMEVSLIRIQVWIKVFLNQPLVMSFRLFQCPRMMNANYTAASRGTACTFCSSTR